MKEKKVLATASLSERSNNHRGILFIPRMHQSAGLVEGRQKAAVNATLTEAMLGYVSFFFTYSYITSTQPHSQFNTRSLSFSRFVYTTVD